MVLVPVGAGASMTAPAASHETGTDAAFIVDLETDGAATLTVRYTFDLSESARAEAFEDLQNNETVRQSTLGKFEQRIEAVANDTENVTGRDLSVGDASIEFRTSGDTGIAELSVTVQNLASVDGDQVTLTEPFASGFQSEREFRVVLPDGYAVDSVTPSADTQGDGELVWESGTDLTGFGLVTSPASMETTTAGDGDGMDSTDGADGTDGGDGADGATDGGGGPGFGIVAALAALGAALVALRRRG